MSNKFGIVFNAFSGLELLKPALLNNRDQVDCIAVVYSEVSNYGKPGPEYMMDLLHDLKFQNLIDVLVKYEIKHPATEPQGHIDHMIAKRDLGRRTLAMQGCSHVQIRDCDEFYLKEDFEKAKNISTNSDITFAYIREFLKSPCYKAKNRSGFYVPFMQESLYPLGRTNLKYKVDPARKPLKVSTQTLIDIEMYHMTRVRFDKEEYNRKYINHSWAPKKEYIEKSLKEIEADDIDESLYDTVEDKFGILEYWEKEFNKYK